MIGRVTGLLREVIFAAIFGAGVAADAYNAAFRVPNLLRELLAEGSLSNVYVPLFARTAEKEGVARAWALANAVLGILLVILGVVTALFLIFAEQFVFLIAAGFADVDGKIEMATWLTRLLAPFLAGLSLASVFGGMLNVRGKFFLPALAPALLNVFVIAACLGANWWEAATGTPAIGAVAVGATLSGLATAAVQYPALRRLGFRFRPHLRGHPGLWEAIRFMGAALIGVTVVQFNLLVESQLASRFGDGPVSYLIYGFRLVQIPISVVAGSIAVASLAALSIHLARDDRDAARATVSRGLELNTLLVVPGAVGLFLLADPLIALLYERGAFTAVDTAATAGILRGYAIAATAICVYRVLLPTFFALRDPWLPMKLSLVTMAAKIPLALLLIYTLEMGIDGLPLSHAITIGFEAIAMMWVLSRRLDGWSPGFWSQQIRIGLAAAGMGGAVWLMQPWAEGFGVVAVCAAGAAVYGVLVLVLRVREAGGIWARVLKRPPPFGPPGPPPGFRPPGGPPGPPPGRP